MRRFYLTLVSLLILSFGSTNAQETYIFPELTSDSLITVLQENYSVSNSLSYNGARDNMFEKIDTLNGGVRGVYSAYTYTYLGIPDRIEAQDNGFNTEHTWPQSFFDQDLPMRSDIHHLFITRQDVNGARSNYKFAEINDNLTTRWYYLDQNQSSIPTSNIDEYSELLSNSSFEPREDFKGNIARAIYYFWTIYQDHPSITGDATDNAAFFESMREVLLDWHLQDEVDEAEVQRSLDIEAVQGNRNPFVHDTTLVRRAYYGAGPIVITSREEASELPDGFYLKQNYPNPFNPGTIIEFGLDRASEVRLEVFDLLGQSIKVLINERLASGQHQVTFEGNDLASGFYIYQLSSSDFKKSKLMILAK